MSTTTAATAETLFPATLKPTKRISAAQFPSDFVATGTGSLAPTGTLSFTVPLGYDADTNPFVHRYHPDHDNLDPLFGTKLGVGKESWTVNRAITLTFATSLPEVTDPAWGVSMLGGTYSETVTGLRATPARAVTTPTLSASSSVKYAKSCGSATATTRPPGRGRDTRREAP